MGVQIRTVDTKIPTIVRTAEVMNGHKVRVGCFNGEHAWLAAIHEYGCTIPVTDRMRAYLHHIGVHLRPSTTQIVIPERSFLRAGHDAKAEEVINTAESVIGDVLVGSMSEGTYLELVGTTLRDAIKEYAVDLSSPAKKPWPTRPGGLGNPLVETGAMINGIEYETE